MATDTASAAPSDVDIDATWDALPGIRIHNDADARGLNTQTMLRRAFARAVLAKWGQPTPPSAAPSERERFEAWAKSHGTLLTKDKRGNYQYTPTSAMWKAWQAARAQPTPPAADQEPFGYFRAEPFGWTDCAETDEGAVALYEHPTPPAVVEPPELSPDFTDTARAALLWVLWHHQGGSSPVGQPIRFALGMGQHDRLNEHQLADAKRWERLHPVNPAVFPHGAVPLTDEQIEKLRRETFSTENPFCPCDSKTMRKAVWAAERAHGIGIKKENGNG